MIRIGESILIREDEIKEVFIRGSGPGGQNVNKVATAVQLRFDAAGSPALTEKVRARLGKIAGSRMTAEGVLIIEAKRFRTREQNRKDARERLVRMIGRAALGPRPRKATGPPRSSRLKRLEAKRRRSRVKDLRRRVEPD